MKIYQLVKLTFILLVVPLPALAQSEKVAVINTDAFSFPPTGITRLVKAIESVEREFDPRRVELVEMYSRAEREGQTGFAGPIPTDPRPMTPERAKEAKERSETMWRAVQQLETEMQIDYRRRTKGATAPVLEDIRKSFQSFAKSRGITLLLDVRREACLVGCEGEFAPALDVTKEFIAEYNQLNP